MKQKKQKAGFSSMLLGTLGVERIEKAGSLKELVMVIIHKIKWIFNTTSSFKKL